MSDWHALSVWHATILNRPKCFITNITVVLVCFILSKQAFYIETYSQMCPKGLFFHSFIHKLINSFIHSFIYLFIHSFIHSFRNVITIHTHILWSTVCIIVLLDNQETNYSGFKNLISIYKGYFLMNEYNISLYFMFCISVLPSYFVNFSFSHKHQHFRVICRHYYTYVIIQNTQYAHPALVYCLKTLGQHWTKAAAMVCEHIHQSALQPLPTLLSHVTCQGA